MTGFEWVAENGLLGDVEIKSDDPPEIMEGLTRVFKKAEII